jgi:Predicted transcriptional regulators
MKETLDVFGICPYFTTQKILAGKWAILILHHLDGKTLRFKELERKLSPITQATLTKQLRTLEDSGLIIRKVYNQVPPKVEYSLSELGMLFKPVLDSLETWGYQYIDYMNKK